MSTSARSTASSTTTERSLKDYQERGRQWIADREGSGLFMDMGLGKTATTLHALADLGGAVILCGPIRVVETVWEEEAKLWPEVRHLKFSLLRGTPTQRAAAAKAKADVYLVNPELLEEALKAVPQAKVLVIDESSMFKNPSSKRFKKLRPQLKRFKHRVILTGTPTPNSLLDLWAQVFICDLGARLGRSFFDYRNRFFEQTDYHGYVFAPRKGAADEIAGLISDIVMRVERFDRKEPTHNPVVFDLPPAVRKIYKQVEHEAFVLLQGETISLSMAMVVMAKLRQVANGFLYTDEGEVIELHDLKIKALEEIVEGTGSPVLVLYHYKKELEMLQKAFPKGMPFCSPLVDKWNAGKIPIMFLNPASGAHGLNLQHGGHTIAVLSGSFSQEQMSQAFARLDRQGQEHHVVIHHITARNTIDELLSEVVKVKAHNQTSLLKRIQTYVDSHHR